MLFRVLHSEFCDLIVRRSIDSAEKVVIIFKKTAGELFVKYWMLKASAVLGKCTKKMVLPGIEPGTFCV